MRKRLALLILALAAVVGAGSGFPAAADSCPRNSHLICCPTSCFCCPNNAFCVCGP